MTWLKVTWFPILKASIATSLIEKYNSVNYSNKDSNVKNTVKTWLFWSKSLACLNRTITVISPYLPLPLAGNSFSTKPARQLWKKSWLSSRLELSRTSPYSWSQVQSLACGWLSWLVPASLRLPFCTLSHFSAPAALATCGSLSKPSPYFFELAISFYWTACPLQI